VAANITEVRRGDALLMPARDLVLEYGDRVGAIVPRDALPGVRAFFGDSLKSAAEFSYVSVGLGMSLGVLLGLIKFPLQGWARCRWAWPAAPCWWRWCLAGWGAPARCRGTSRWPPT